MSTQTMIWTEHEQKILMRLGDLLIPGGNGMPKAADTDLIAGTVRVCGIRPDLVEPAKELIRNLEELLEWSVEDIRARYPELFLNTSELLAGAYFLNEDVIRTLDYLDRPTIPLDPEGARDAEMQELVEPVLSRGNVWRTTV